MFLMSLGETFDKILSRLVNAIGQAKEPEVREVHC